MQTIVNNQRVGSAIVNEKEPCNKLDIASDLLNSNNVLHTCDSNIDLLLENINKYTINKCNLYNSTHELLTNDSVRNCQNVDLCTVAMDTEVFNSNWMRVIKNNSEYTIYAKDRVSEHSPEVIINVSIHCINGTCECNYYLKGAHTQLKPCRVFSECFLRGDIDPDWNYIMQGSIFGFLVINPEANLRYANNNYKNDISNITLKIEKKLKKEISLGYITKVDEKPHCIHGMFGILKTNGSIRGIIDCSQPKGHSVNNNTSEVCLKFSYNSVDNVNDIMVKNDYISTIDISDAYRALNIHPINRPLQGLQWDFGQGNNYYQDNRLCMGLSSSPYVFSKVSDFVVRCGIREGIDRVVNYLDDFAIVSANINIAKKQQNKFINILRRLGFHISYNKISSPNQITRFLGIDIDTHAMEMRLPDDKINKLLDIIEAFLSKKKATKKELERLGGLLAHCCKVVKGGRSFCRRVYDMMTLLKKKHYKVRLNKEFFKDLIWWKQFVKTFNGKAKILGLHAPTVSVYSDASLWGYGALHGNDWLVGCFKNMEPNEKTILGHHYDNTIYTEEDIHINVYEMWSVLQALKRWYHKWRDKNVLIVTDNNTVKSALNTGRCKNKCIMKFMRQIFWMSIENNFSIASVYIKSEDNHICDALSRLNNKDNYLLLKSLDSGNQLCCHYIFDSFHS